MSNPENNPDLKAFEAALASLRPRVDRLDPRWRDLLAGQAALMEDFVARASCPCCGRPWPDAATDTAPAVRIRRLAWPASFSVMTAVAGALLVALMIRSEPPLANSGGKPETVPKAVAIVESRAEDATSDAAMSTAARDPSERYARFWGSDFSRRALSPRKVGDQRMLTAADIELPNDFFSLRDRPITGHGPTSGQSIETAAASLTNYELLRQLLEPPRQ